MCSAKVMAVQQIIESRYIDRKKLEPFLRKTFGLGNFSARLQLNCWVLKMPRRLDELEIESCYYIC